MDPITVVGFLAAVVQLIDVTSKVVNYFNDVKDAPKDRSKLVREATGLLALFADLRYRVEETTSTSPWFTGLRSLGERGGPLMEFKNAMDDIADKLVPPSSTLNLRRVLRWTFDKKEIDAILSKIERLKTLVSLALQKDHFKLSLAMKEEITVGFQEMKTNRDDEKITNIKKWLAAPVPSLNHNTAMKKRQPRTGEWFTHSWQFAEWKLRTNSPIIWLHGIPGCGKTILCSTIIQDIISQYQSEPTIAIAYFYFDFNDMDKQRTEKLIRSLILQFAVQCPKLPESLESAYTRSLSESKQPTTEELTFLLGQVVKYFDSIYILLDALDECTDREDLFEFIVALIDGNNSDLHLLVTSRKENDIAMSLEPLVKFQQAIQGAHVDADIRVHILEMITNDPKLKKWPANVQKEIENALMRGANGMFRWVVCQLDSLRKCLKLDALRKALNTLPKTLDDTYERILASLEEEYEEDALRIFEWLCFSARPIRLDEIVEVLAIDLTTDSCFKPEQKLPDPRDILTICSTLVSTAATEDDMSTQTTGTQELRLAHFSVKEYLVSDRLKKTSVHRYHIEPLSANVSMTKICLTYLLHFESPTILTAKFDDEFPFIKYAAEFWHWHYKYITDDADREAVDFLGCSLAESQNCFINWLRIFNEDSPWSESDLDLKTNRIPSSLYYMSIVGVSGVVQLLLNKEANFNDEDGLYDDALSATSFIGHKEVVRMLLEKGANVNAAGRNYGHALSGASYEGHKEVVQLLLENGANVNAEGGPYGNALSAASFGGHKGVVKILLENGANADADCGTHGSALSAASCGGYEEVVQLLLEKGANVNAAGRNYGHALSGASCEGHEKVVQLLLENGANVNAEGGPYGTALSAASSNGHEEVVRLLLENGANVNAEDRINGSALSAASHSGFEEVAQLLLENGANVNADNEIHGNALSAASDEGHEEVVQLLLENGANVNAEGKFNGSALSVASCRGHDKIVRLLLENGAKVDANDETYGNALSVASYTGQEDVVRLLLERGANVNAEGGFHGSALSAASCGGYEEVVRLLVEGGADVNAHNGRALRKAFEVNQMGVVRLLLEKGASITIM